MGKERGFFPDLKFKTQARLTGAFNSAAFLLVGVLSFEQIDQLTNSPIENILKHGKQ